MSAANLNGAEIILFDTAGRTQIDLANDERNKTN